MPFGYIYDLHKISSIKAAIICANQIYSGFNWWKRGESNP
nr:MAG TPA: hypothetical protein [Caudoviricetes sp.]